MFLRYCSLVLLWTSLSFAGETNSNPMLFWLLKGWFLSPKIQFILENTSEGSRLYQRLEGFLLPGHRKLRLPYDSRTLLIAERISFDSQYQPLAEELLSRFENISDRFVALRKVYPGAEAKDILKELATDRLKIKKMGFLQRKLRQYLRVPRIEFLPVTVTDDHVFATPGTLTAELGFLDFVIDKLQGGIIRLRESRDSNVKSVESVLADFDASIERLLVCVRSILIEIDIDSSSQSRNYLTIAQNLAIKIAEAIPLLNETQSTLSWRKDSFDRFNLAQKNLRMAYAALDIKPLF